MKIVEYSTNFGIEKFSAMPLFRCLIVLLVNYFSAALGATTDCGPQATNFLRCVANVREGQRSKELEASSVKTFRDGVLACFSKGECSAPYLETDLDVYERLGLGDGSDLKKFTKCNLDTLKIARSNVEKCVAKSVPGLHFAPVVDPPDISVRQPLLSVWAAEIYVASRNTTICPERVNGTQKLDRCVSKVYSKAELLDTKNSYKTLLRAEKSVKEFCDANCFSKISTGCTNVLNETYSMACKCFTDDFHQKYAQYSKRIADCYGGGENAAPKNANGDQNAAVAKTSGFEAEGIRLQLQTEMCQPPPENHCDQSFVQVVKFLYLFSGGGSSTATASASAVPSGGAKAANKSVL